MNLITTNPFSRIADRWPIQDRHLLDQLKNLSDNYSFINFEALEAAGCTDIIYGDGFFTATLNQMNERIALTLNALSSTDINLHLNNY